MPADGPASIYETQLVPTIFEPLAQILIERARPKLGEYVLDAACGTGVVARSVAPMVGLSGRTVGLDFDPIMIEMARRLAPEIEWRHGDLQNLPFADGFFDLVICQQGLQYLPDRNAGLRQIYRVLRPGGRMVLATWTDLARSPGHFLLFEVLGVTLDPDRVRPTAWSLADEAQLLKLVSEAGFVSVTTSIISLQTTYPSARRFVEIVLNGSSKVTREDLAQIRLIERPLLLMRSRCVCATMKRATLWNCRWKAACWSAIDDRGLIEIQPDVGKWHAGCIDR
jgi:SAM-dependent methyltransferase